MSYALLIRRNFILSTYFYCLSDKSCAPVQISKICLFFSHRKFVSFGDYSQTESVFRTGKYHARFWLEISKAQPCEQNLRTCHCSTRLPIAVSHFSLWWGGGGVRETLYSVFCVFSISVRSSFSVTFRKHSIFITFPTM